jgi:ArsR family transcriptional regulator, lead/cadmium/zinc/bismuth-responsive transcriptional repressor
MIRFPWMRLEFAKFPNSLIFHDLAAVGKECHAQARGARREKDFRDPLNWTTPLVDLILQQLNDWPTVLERAMDPHDDCLPHEHPSAAEARGRLLAPATCQHAANIFRALGDAGRLRLLALMVRGEMCVSELAEALEESLPAISQRLKLLKSERIVTSRREGKHVFYSLDDQHIKDLIANALAHAAEDD